MTFAPFGPLDVESIYKELEFLTLEQTLTLERAKFIHKREKGLLPAVIANYFNLEPTNNHNYNLRQRPSRSNFRANTATGRKSIQCVGETLWRELPQYLKTINSPSTFKKFVKSYLIAAD